MTKVNFPLLMDFTVNCAGSMGVAGGQPFSCDSDKFTISNEVCFAMGHKGCCAGLRNYIFLGINGDEHLYGHQSKSVVVANRF